MRPIRGIILHHTGIGLLSRWQKSKVPTFGQFAVDYYTKAKFKPHYVLDGQGMFRLIASEDQVVLHTGSKGHARKPTEYWVDRWYGLRSPKDLFNDTLWVEGSANELSIGIEVLPNPVRPLGPWTKMQYRAIKDFAESASKRHGFVLNTTTVIGHYDANPHSREKNGKPWDPWEAQWNPTIARALFL